MNYSYCYFYLKTLRMGTNDASGEGLEKPTIRHCVANFLLVRVGSGCSARTSVASCVRSPTQHRLHPVLCVDTTILRTTQQAQLLFLFFLKRQH